VAWAIGAILTERRKWPWFLVLLAGLYWIHLAQTRIIFGSVLMVPAVLTLTYFRLGRSAIWALLTVTVAAVVAVNRPETVQETRSYMIRQEETVSNLSGRTFRWEYLLDKWQEHPVLGWGYQSGTRALGIANIGRFKAYDAHNSYLEVLVSLGLLGMLPFALAVLLSLYETLTLKRRLPDAERRTTAYVFLCLMVPHLLLQAATAMPLVGNTIYGNMLWASVLVACRWAFVTAGEHAPAPAVPTADNVTRVASSAGALQ
jgi:O-antigen ligase